MTGARDGADGSGGTVSETAPLRLYKNIALDPFQQRAIEAIDRGHSVLICAPTGAGKTLVAEYAIEKSIRESTRLVYTAPIKALNNQKFRDFSAAYPGKIGIKTGDVSIHSGAPIVLMTTEIFRNMIFDSPEALADVQYAVLDEIHYLDDIERGTVWEECIIFAPPHIRLVCLSATVPNYDLLAGWIRKVRPDTELELIFEASRPVPLEHNVFVPRLGVKTLQELRALEEQPEARLPASASQARPATDWTVPLIRHLGEAGRLPAIVFCFNRKACEELAHAVRGSLLGPEERRRMLAEYDRLSRQFLLDGAADDLRGLLARGVCYHHAGLLPTVKEVIERLFATGLVKILFATETFAVGINMPARSVVFSSVFKFDGRRLSLMKTREHHQMSGRAGRRGIDTVGYAYSVAAWPSVPARQLAVLLEGQIEPIHSQFNLSYSAVLSLWERLRDRIFRAAEQSLGHYLDQSRGIGRTRAALRAKLDVLRRLGYLDGEELTDRGRAAMKIYGYELVVTELLFSGIMYEISHEELALLAAAACFESKRGARFRIPHDGRFRWLRRRATRAVERILGEEERAGLEGETKPLDFRLSSATLAWMRGAEFAALERHTTADPGDIVRFWRMTIQILRNTLAVAPDPGLAKKIHRAIDGINRDEVDAERQLRLGGSLPEEVS